MNITLYDLLVWLSDVPLSVGQIQKDYDWNIAQWSAFANAVLAAIFGIVSTSLVEIYKGLDIKHTHFRLVVGFGALAYLGAYALCMKKIAKLRQEFIMLYTFLQDLR